MVLQNEKRKKEKVTSIGIIGDINTGKSYILNKLTELGNIERYAGEDIKTEGLSCKYHRFPNEKKWYLLFDTKGNSEPLTTKKKIKKIIKIYEKKFNSFPKKQKI